MIRDLGIIEPGTTLYLPFHTFDSNDPTTSVTLTGLATTDIEIYKDGSATARTSDSGYALLDTDGIDFSSKTGIHGLSINLADNDHAGFFAAGSQYWVVIASVTVDAATVNFVLATFRIGYQNAVLNTTIASLSSQTSFTLTAGPAEADALNGMWCVIHDVASAVQKGIATILDYDATTKTVTLVAGTTFTAAATDNISVMGPSPLQPTTTGRTLDVSTGGEAGIDWANVGTPGSTVSLSATTVATVTTTTTATTATNLTNLPAITSNWLTATGLDSTAVNEIADGILGRDASTSTTNSTLGAIINDLEDGGRTDLIVDAILVDTGTTLQAELDGIQADTEDIQSRLPAALVNSRMDCTIDGTGMETGAVDAILNRDASASTTNSTLGAIINDLENGGRTDLILDDILADTAVIGAAGAGLSAIPWNAAWDAEVQSEVEDGLVTHRLDELLNADSDIDGAAPPTVGSVFHELMSKTAGSFTFDQTTDSLEAVRDKAIDVETDTQDIQSRIPAALTGAGNMKADALLFNGSAVNDTIETAVGTALAGTDVTDFTAIPAGTPNLLEALGFLYAQGFYRKEQTATTTTLYDGDNNAIAEATTSDNGTTFVRTKFAAP